MLPAPRSGVLVRLDEPALVQLADEADVVLCVRLRLGDYVPAGGPLLEVTGDAQRLDAEAVLRAVRLARDRTLEQDVAFGFRQLVDIADRALSPGINDPTTAVQVLDELHDLLRRLATRPLHRGQHADDRGRLRLQTMPQRFGDYLALALDEVQHYGADSVQVPERVRRLLEDLQAAGPGGAPPRRGRADRRRSGPAAGSVTRTLAAPTVTCKTSALLRGQPLEMNASLHRRRSAAGLVALVLVATGCAGNDEEREQTPDPPGPAAQPFPGGGVNGVNARVGAVRLLDVSFDEPPDRSYDVGDVALLRFVLNNEGVRPDALLAAATPVASRARLLHDRDCDGQVERVDEIPLAAQEAVRTPAPGVPDGPQRSAVEVVLDQRLLAGETAPVTFRFRNAGSGTVQVPVELTGQRNLEDPDLRCHPVR